MPFKIPNHHVCSLVSGDACRPVVGLRGRDGILVDHMCGLRGPQILMSWRRRWRHILQSCRISFGWTSRGGRATRRANHYHRPWDSVQCGCSRLCRGHFIAQLGMDSIIAFLEDLKRWPPSICNYLQVASCLWESIHDTEPYMPASQ